MFSFVGSVAICGSDARRYKASTPLGTTRVARMKAHLGLSLIQARLFVPVVCDLLRVTLFLDLHRGHLRNHSCGRSSGPRLKQSTNLIQAAWAIVLTEICRPTAYTDHALRETLPIDESPRSLAISNHIKQICSWVSACGEDAS